MTTRRGSKFFVHSFALAVLLAALAFTGCAEQRRPRLPQTPQELAAQQRIAPKAFTAREIAKHNFDRVRDGKLDPVERVASLAVLIAVDGNNPAYHADLAADFTRASTPPQVRSALLLVLARQDDEAISPHVVSSLVQTQDEILAAALRQWLTRHRRTQAFSVVVRNWADTDPTDEIRRQRYEQAVEAIRGEPWKDALLEAMNVPAFNARGSAWELLLHNTDRPELLERLGSMKAATPAVEAIQYYMGQLGYLPRNRQELLRAVEMYIMLRPELDRAVPVAQVLATEDGYNFNPRDVHLLGGLGAFRDAWKGDVAASSQPAAIAEKPAADRQPASAPALLLSDRLRLGLMSQWLASGNNSEKLAAMASAPSAEPVGGIITCCDGCTKEQFFQSARPRSFIPSEEMIKASQNCLGWFAMEPRKDKGGSETIPAVGDPQARLRDCPALLILRQGNELVASYWTPNGQQTVEIGRIPLPKK